MSRDATHPHGRFGGPNTIGVGVFSDFTGRVPEPPPQPDDPQPTPEPLPEPAPDPAPNPPTPNPIAGLSREGSGSTSAPKSAISTLHGGTNEVESPAEAGTRLVVTLPSGLEAADH